MLIIISTIVRNVRSLLKPVSNITTTFRTEMQPLDSGSDMWEVSYSAVSPSFPSFKAPVYSKCHSRRSKLRWAYPLLTPTIYQVN